MFNGHCGGTPATEKHSLLGGKQPDVIRGILRAPDVKNHMSLVCAKLQFGKGGEVAATFCNRDVTVVLCT